MTELSQSLLLESGTVPERYLPNLLNAILQIKFDDFGIRGIEIEQNEMEPPELVTPVTPWLSSDSV